MTETTDGGVHYVVNVEGAVYRDGEYLLARRSPREDHAAGELSLVGGKVEGVEETRDVLEETVARELCEEVGVAVGAVEYVRSAAFLADGGDRVVNVVFLCAHESGEATVRAPEEIAEVHWITPDEVDDRDDLPWYTREYLRAADERRRELGW